MRDVLEWLENPWLFLVVGYCVTVAIETPILCVGLSPQHALSRRILAGFWLTACTYPIIVLVVPRWFSPGDDRLAYLVAAESIAHVGECLLFYLAFGPLKQPVRDLATVFSANLASFGLGELLYYALGLYEPA